MNKFDEFLERELEALDREGLRRELRPLESAHGTRLRIGGRDVLNFCSNDYLGLADDSRIKEAAVKAMDAEGFGAGASRLVCGNMPSHRQLEKRLAEVKRTEAAILFSTGYMANVGMISGLFGPGDMICCDRLNHASIIDGILLSQAKFKRYPHNDMKALEETLRSAMDAKRRVIITDSVFSMDGDLAPLDDIVRLARRHDALVMIDEAHAFGIMGENGKGLAEHFGLERHIDIQMGTLSKAAGCFGAYVCGSQKLIDYLINKSRSFIYTTAMPPSNAAAALRAVEIIMTEPELRSRLWMNTNHLRDGLNKMGFNTMRSETPIIPVLTKDAATALQFSRRLLEEGILISAIRPPTVPANTSRLRIAVTAKHTSKDLELLLKSMGVIGKELCLI